MEAIKSRDNYTLKPTPGNPRSIGRWGRMYLSYLQDSHPDRYNSEVQSEGFWDCLTDLNEEASNRLQMIIQQMKKAEGVTEELKRKDAMAWVGRMNSIKARAEEIIIHELIYTEEEK